MESTNNPSLMKKTKAQLIEIIERKDDVEKRILGREKELKEKLEKANHQLESTIVEHNNARKELLKKEGSLVISEREVATKQKVIDKLVSERDKAEREVSQHQETIDALMTEKVKDVSTIKNYNILTWCLTIALIATIIVAIVCQLC